MLFPTSWSLDVLRAPKVLQPFFLILPCMNNRSTRDEHGMVVYSSEYRCAIYISCLPPFGFYSDMRESLNLGQFSKCTFLASQLPDLSFPDFIRCTMFHPDSLTIYNVYRDYSPHHPSRSLHSVHRRNHIKV